MSRNYSLKVAIDAQSTSMLNGGISTAVKSLIRDLGRLSDGDESYIVVVSSEEQVEWLKPVIGPNQKFVLRPKPKESFRDKNGSLSAIGLLKLMMGPLLPATRYLQRHISNKNIWPEVPLSNGFWESTGCQIVHFPTQSFTICSMPSVYNPHDLQHLHYPSFWSPETIAWRETIYPAGCHFAKTVVVGSEWIKRDIIQQYRTFPEKVQIIPEGPPTHADSEPTQEFMVKVKNKYKLETPFALYPAVTWAHKNHIRLLEALALLRDSADIRVSLVCTGAFYMEYWPNIKNCLSELNLHNQVKFLGRVPDEEMRSIFKLSQFLIQPSLFEASSLPIFEAWLEGLPVACSNVTALPDQVLDAGILFDPNSVASISDAIAQIATKTEVREELQKKGFERLKDFDCERTAKAYRAVYRKAAGIQISEEDNWLLKWDWMRNPKRTRDN